MPRPDKPHSGAPMHAVSSCRMLGGFPAPEQASGRPQHCDAALDDTCRPAVARRETQRTTESSEKASTPR
jgi:hypothetical protein